MYLSLVPEMLAHTWWQLSVWDAKGLQCHSNNSEFKTFIVGVIQMVPEDNLNLCNLFWRVILKKGEHGLVRWRCRTSPILWLVCSLLWAGSGVPHPSGWEALMLHVSLAQNTEARWIFLIEALCRSTVLRCLHLKRRPKLGFLKELFPVPFRAVPTWSKKGGLRGVVAVAQNKSRRKAAKDQLAGDADAQGLTGWARRRKCGSETRVQTGFLPPTQPEPLVDF